MSPRAVMMLLTVVPLLAVEPGLSSAGQPALENQELIQQLQQAETLARQAGEQLIQSLQTLERDIPHYGLPYLDDRGNIVIPLHDGQLHRGVPIPEPGPSRT
jgi:hypothetical protein